ncbi:hypothetical protein HOP50_13g69220 [Chloropicon primus]|nr:hypothetical protein HOP50_13g69220 [Chloropicon primus]
MVSKTEVRGVAEQVGAKGHARDVPLRYECASIVTALWLEITWSVLFLVVAAWRIAVPLDEFGNSTDAARHSAYFNAANFTAIGLLGLGCVFWPVLSSWRESRRTTTTTTTNAEEDPQPRPVCFDEVVVSGRSLRVLPCRSLNNTERSLRKLAAGATLRASMRSVRLQSARDEEAPALKEGGKMRTPMKSLGRAADDDKPLKGGTNYLSNLRSLLIFLVVTFHIVDVLSDNVSAYLGCLSAASGAGAYHTTFWTGARWFVTTLNRFWMSVFFLISALFCPKSLDKKGFRGFVLGKIVRLGGPFLIYSSFLAPLLWMGLKEYAKHRLLPDNMLMALVGMAGANAGTITQLLEFRYLYAQGPTWFILWLLNFTVAYAVIAQFTKPARIPFPHPFLLMVLGLGLGGVFYSVRAAVHGTGYDHFGDMNRWEFGLAEYLPAFAAGVVGGRNRWLAGVEKMDAWVVWTLRAIVLGFWVIFFCDLAQYWEVAAGALRLDSELLACLTPPVYTVPVTLVILHAWSRWFNTTSPSKITRAVWETSYAAYANQTLFYMPLFVAYVEILKAAGVNVLGEALNFATTTKRADPLVEGCIWGAFFFVTITTHLLLWPCAYGIRSLPVLRRMY